MPKNKISDPITDQEIAFAHLILSGAMTDRQAAEAAGLNPDSAAYTKSKPRVRAYMLEHRAAVEQQLVQQEADLSRRAVDGLHRLNLDREKVLNRLWELAALSPEMTRNSITGQVKAISIIVAMLDLIPDRRAVSSAAKSAPAPARAQIYEAEWLRKQKAATHATTDDPQPAPAPVPQEAAPAVPQPDFATEPVPEPVPEPALSEVEWATPDPVPSQPAFAPRVPFADGLPPYVPQSPFVPDTRVPFSIKVNPFKHRR
jgi:hypothetical protein